MDVGQGQDSRDAIVITNSEYTRYKIMSVPFVRNTKERRSYMRVTVMMLIIFLICMSSGTSLNAEPPTYIALKTGCLMVMDGILDEPAWEKAKPVGPYTFQWYESGEKEQTETKIVWDDERIYFAFACDDTPDFKSITIIPSAEIFTAGSGMITG